MALTGGYQSSYIVGRHPGRFGNFQDDYLVKSEQIIEGTAQKIIQCKEEKGDLQRLFFEIIVELSAKRAQIAKEHQTEQAKEFGQRRDAYYPGRISHVILAQVYQEYGDKLTETFSNYLREMRRKGMKDCEFRDS